jgi:hypothetical protein
VNLGGRALPAELAVLAAEVGPEEHGAWLNSRSTASGVVDLVLEDGEGGRPVFTTRRQALPSFVSAALDAVYEQSGLGKGCPDLVIWNPASRRVRLVEVKCPRWDRPSAEQEKFMEAAATLGVSTCVAEWEFAGPLAEHAVVGNDQMVARACELA